jgi:serine protease AprX
MRLKSLRGFLPFLLALVVALAATLAAFVAPAGADEGDQFGNNVDSALVALATSPSIAPGSQLHVIVFGRTGSAAAAKFKAKRDLGFIRAESGTVSVTDLAALARDKGVKYIALDSPMAPTAVGTPVVFPSLSTLYPTVDGAQSAWNLGYTGAGVGVAVIDSGSTSVPDFGGRLTQVVLSGQLTSADTYGHGTFVSSIVGGASPDGKYVGVAPGVTLFGIDVLNSSGTLYSSDVIAGLNWVAANAAANNIRVVNVSLAETNPSSYLSSALDSAVEQLWRAGVVVVTSAGNLGPATMLYAPANDPFVITVGATDTHDTASTADDTVAAFSSSGTTQDGFAKPDLLAPGRHITALLPPGTTLGLQAPAANVVAPGYATMSGTSFAAPQVAAAAALLLQQHPTWTPDQIKWVLSRTLRTLAGSTVGALDVSAAIAYASPPGSANAGVAPAPQQPTAPVAPLTPTSSGWNSSGWNTSGWNAFAWG